MMNKFKGFIKKIASALSIGIVALGAQAADVDENPYEFKKGEGVLTINFDKSFDLDSLDVSVLYSSFFDEVFDGTKVGLLRTESAFCGTIPLERERDVVFLRVQSPSGPIALGFVELSPEHSLRVEISKDDDDHIVISKNDEHGFNAFSLVPDAENVSLAIGSVIGRLASYHLGMLDGEPSISAEDFDKWSTIGNKFDTLQQVLSEYLLPDTKLPNDIKEVVDKMSLSFFDGGYRMNLSLTAGQVGRMPETIPSYPPGYYKFLDEIDYPLLINSNIPTFSPNYLVGKVNKTLLADMPIGDKDVALWKSEVYKELSKYMVSIPEELLDMLAANRFVSQIESNRTLTDVQVSNIKEGMGALSEIILDKNDKLVKQTSRQTEMLDLMGEEFDLQAFLDSRFAGRPVVIDMWNTWCGPCRAAMQALDGADVEYGDVARLYISDDSSDKGEWEILAPRTGGVQVRLSRDEAAKIAEKYGITGIPTYLFFDSNHVLQQQSTGFPGIDAYKKIIYSLR